MKILHLLIMMLFYPILAFFIPGISVEESLTVSTDKISYHYGDNYTVSGKVNPVVPNEAVSILILSTNYQHPESFSVMPNSEGRYSHTLSLPIKDVSDGNFTIIAQYAGVKNQTAFNYTGLPCYQQNIPGYAYPAPIIRPPASNPRILDSSGNAIIGPVKIGQQIQITYPLANGLNCNQPFVYIVQIQDINGITVSLSWITGVLHAGQSFDPVQSWTPQHDGTYTAQIFTWQSLDNPNALAPPASIAFGVESDANSTKSSQIVSEIPSNSTTENSTTVPNSPLKQFKSGIPVKDIICTEGQQLMVKSENGSPVCVRPDTAQKLIERGQALNYANLVEKESISLSAYQGVTNETFYNNGTVASDFTIDVNINNFKPSNASLFLQVYYNDEILYKTVSIPSDMIQQDGFYKYLLVAVSDKNHPVPFKVVATYNKETAITYAPVFAHP